MIRNSKRNELLQNYLQEMQSIKELPPYSKEELDQSCLVYFEDTNSEWVDVFSEDGKIIGFIIIGYTPNCHPDADFYIEEAYIQPEYRRKKYMFRAVTKFLKYNGGTYCLFIVNRNTPALNFWHYVFKENGYLPVELTNIVPLEPYLKQYGFGREK